MTVGVGLGTNGLLQCGEILVDCCGGTGNEVSQAGERWEKMPEKAGPSASGCARSHPEGRDDNSGNLS